MSGCTRWIVHLYAGLLRLYPGAFRIEFEEEMLAVFADAIREAAARSRLSLAGVCLRELGDWPTNVLLEHRSSALRRVREALVSKASDNVYDTPGLVCLPGLAEAGGGWGAFLSGNMRLRRTFDVLCSLICLIVATPLLLVIAVLVRLDSSGPVLFRQQRLGRDGRPFTMLKFRSMFCVAPGVQPSAYVSEREPRVTRVGRVIRCLKLDELPQLVNVLKGEMSIVGPRPELPR
jgi:hypothetical protein